MNTSNGMTLRTTTGPAVVAGGIRVTPESRVLTVWLPFGGFVWNRPSAVMVERDGRMEWLPIVDVTRVMLGVLWACSLAAWLALRRRCR